MYAFFLHDMLLCSGSNVFFFRYLFSNICPWSFGMHAEQIADQVFSLIDVNRDNSVSFKV